MRINVVRNAAAGGTAGPGPSQVIVVNQGGPNNNQNTGASASLTNYIAIQWTPVASATGYNIYRAANGGSQSQVGTNIQPSTMVASVNASNIMTVTSDGSYGGGGKIIPGVRWTGGAAETMINAWYTANSTSGTGGTGTYQVNVPSQGSTTFSACYFIDSAATNATHPLYDGPNTFYDYYVTAIVGGVESAQSTDQRMYIYQNGYSNMTRGDTTNGADLSFGPPFPNPIWNSTNGSPQGGTHCLEVTVNGGFQPNVDTVNVPDFTCEIGWAKYLNVDFNPGSAYTGWAYNLHGMLVRGVGGDVFPIAPGSPGFNLVSGTYGPVPQANTWASYKIPVALCEINKNSFTGSISNGSGGAGSTCVVTGVGTGLFGSSGTFDNGAFISGTGIPAGAWVQANISGGPGVGSWTIYGSNNAPVSLNVTSDGTWVMQRTHLYKFALYGDSAPTQQSYLNNIYLSRT